MGLRGGGTAISNGCIRTNGPLSSVCVSNNRHLRARPTLHHIYMYIHIVYIRSIRASCIRDAREGEEGGGQVTIDERWGHSCLHSRSQGAQGIPSIRN